MLRSRLITAAMLIPLVVLAILWLPSVFFVWLIGLLMLLGAREMARLGGLKQTLEQLSYVAVILGLMGLSEFWLSPEMNAGLRQLMVLFWLLVSGLLIAWRREVKPVDRRRPGILLIGGLILIVAWQSIAELHRQDAQGPALVLFLFILIWVADSGAYFAGRAWGRRKLSPMVSPGKTWAGVTGALLGAALCGVVLDQFGGLAASGLALLALCLLVTLVSIGGDLFESLLKRQAQLKDSGNLLPGHGGALDRIDSLLAAAPVFMLGVQWLGMTP